MYESSAGRPENEASLLPADAEAQALCRALLAGTRDDVLIADEVGTITFISRNLARTAGTEPERLLGQAADRALSAMELPSFSELKGMLSSVSNARMEAEMVDGDGNPRPVLLRGAGVSLPDGDGRYTWLVTPLSRVRTVERANRYLRSELETKSRVLALVSHELRTPLNVILTQLSLLEAGLQGDLTDDQRECVERSLRAGQGLLSLINDLIDFAKMETEEPSLELRPFAPEPLVEEVAEELAEVVEGAGLSLEIRNEAGDARAMGDYSRTRQILHRLVSNAVKFSVGGTVRVILRPAELPSGAAVPPADDGDLRSTRYLGFDVCDDGTGIPRSDLGRVFDPFEQAADVLTRQEEGSGLGLAIARRLARLQHGDLMVHRASSEGSVFRLYLPRAE